MPDLRPDPEALLRQAEADGRGRLKVFLGYAPGVGKSFRLFDEGRRRHERGEDVIVGAVAPELSAELQAVVQQLEAVPHAGGRRPAGRLPWTPCWPGIRPSASWTISPTTTRPAPARPKRYQDVAALIDAGISVLTSINLEEIDEQQPFIEQLFGPAQRRDGAAVLHRPRRRESSSSTRLKSAPLGEIAGSMRSVLSQLAPAGAAAHGRCRRAAARRLPARSIGIRSSWGTQERILVCMTPRANAAAMLASGRRNADRFHGELFAVYVTQPNLTAEDRSALARNVMLARAQQAAGRHPRRQGSDRGDPRLRPRSGITQLFVGHNLRRDVADAAGRQPAGPPDPRRRRHRRPRLPALTP